MVSFASAKYPCVCDSIDMAAALFDPGNVKVVGVPVCVSGSDAVVGLKWCIIDDEAATDVTAGDA